MLCLYSNELTDVFIPMSKNRERVLVLVLVLEDSMEEVLVLM